MRIIYFSYSGCYPCERASEVLRKYPALQLEIFDRRSSTAKEFDVTSVPTVIVVDEKGQVLRQLSGAHMITNLEVQGIITDFITC
ncbi:thioredoxin domain [Vibrio phage D249]|nr:hypothetical protein SIPHO036v1_80010 [Vibrio phage 70E38.1]QZI88022.1 hypothetical protein SIPHO041v1_p0111 [Vibrio phage 234P1]QZI88196.1 hypothetical protein SIPHO035v1_p0105 [Vibrio phage 234P7B]QZI88338.1 hypothetical protein SIPHO082v1_p0061 [Vibrio phage 294E48.1]QZI88562.1 hypothetical protein SIPHO037v1_p0121 [Vibrio phage 70E35.2]QZI88746.1 hypothetical protein SIPHO039v1_p0117 [Vibrio phage 70E35.5a]QZI88929.1 hypothetical protein SIPHO040v1_p0116 [Vibrio phage 70E35.6]QZI89091